MFRAFRLPLAFFFAAGLLACGQDGGPVASSASDESGEAAVTGFRAFLDEAYAEDMARYPLTATYRGIKTGNDQWNPVSETFQEDTRAINERRLARLQTFDRDALAADEQLSWDLYKLNLERLLARDAFRHHDFVITQFRGPHTVVPSTLINIHRVNSPADAEDYIGRLNGVGDYFDQVIAQLEIRTEKGLTLADWQYPKIVQSARNVVTGVPYDDSGEDSTLWADFQDKVAGLTLDEATRERLLAEARTALVDVVGPAYERLIVAVEAQAEDAAEADGIWRFPRAKDYYATRLNWYTTTDLSADEVHEIGLAEVARIHGEMRAIMETVGFEDSLQDFFEFMRTDEQFYYPNTDAGRADYLADARRSIDAMRERLPEYFGLLPEAEIVVKRVEAFREQSAGKAFYQAPPKDGSRPGIYYANLYDMANMPSYQLQALAFHEGIPGHHMQRAITVALDDIPEFQKYASFTAYTEGWGLYTEELAKEMGFYEDPYSDFGRLAMELWRACRLVVDTGIHSKRWSREEAIDYLLEHTPNPEGDAVNAIERYIAMPGQATAYMIGKLKLMALREEARRALGEGFDIRAFHDEVLKDGPVPLSILERKIEGLVDAAKAG
ncbi:DUF885 domain-containing protein [Pseudohaliea rubra]|uniref:Lipoprotein n=1 Tax=Pseudohaliea rubra DSM 19751 TaxID=1265313 RepID=A0A095VTH3_9GAMM|nr:DUF885 domain-containing protein [Pseudohaliea rubra]KGE04655.1 hypothetical protein HRUBRA_00729 [Pseudohaliea rubra DSM 19751]